MKAVLAPLLCFLSALAVAAEPRPLPTAHTTRDIEGWSVRVDDRLLHGEAAPVGERALKLLTARLVAITIVVPEPSLTKLRAIRPTTASRASTGRSCGTSWARCTSAT